MTDQTTTYLSLPPITPATRPRVEAGTGSTGRAARTRAGCGEVLRQTSCALTHPSATRAPDTFRPVMTKVEAADYLRVSPRTLTNLLAARKLRAARIGRRVVIKKAELDRFLDLLTAQ